MSARDPLLLAMKAAVCASCEIGEGSAWLMAQRVITALDRAGFKVISPRTPELHESRSMNVTLAQYQQILGERNAALAEIDRLRAEVERYRDIVGDAETDVVEILETPAEGGSERARESARQAEGSP